MSRTISPATDAGRIDGLLSITSCRAYSDCFIRRLTARELTEADRAEYRRAFEKAASAEGARRFGH